MIKKRRNEKAAGRRRQKYTQMSTMEKGERKKERKKERQEERKSIGRPIYLSFDSSQTRHGKTYLNLLGFVNWLPAKRDFPRNV